MIDVGIEVYFLATEKLYLVLYYDVFIYTFYWGIEAINI